MTIPTTPPGAGPSPAQVFASRRDGWLVVVLSLSAAMSTGGALLLLAAAPPPRALSAAVALLLLASAAFVVWVLRTTRYVLEPGRLLIRSGPFRWAVDLDSIEEVAPSRSPLSAPALSLDRLIVRFGPRRRGILISPDDREGFLEALAAAAPGLRRDGDRLRRAQGTAAGGPAPRP